MSSREHYHVMIKKIITQTLSRDDWIDHHTNIITWCSKISSHENYHVMTKKSSRENYHMTIEISSCENYHKIFLKMIMCCLKKTSHHVWKDCHMMMVKKSLCDVQKLHIVHNVQKDCHMMIVKKSSRDDSQKFDCVMMIKKIITRWNGKNSNITVLKPDS